MDFSVWTRRLQITREFWHFGDIVLPVAIPAVPAGVALAALFVEFQLGQRFHLNLSFLPPPLPLVAPFLLPLVGWWLAGKPAIEGLPVERYLLAQLRYFLTEPRTIVHLRRAWEPERPRLSEVAFQERAP